MYLPGQFISLTLLDKIGCPNSTHDWLIKTLGRIVDEWIQNRVGSIEIVHFLLIGAICSSKPVFYAQVGNIFS